MYKKVADLGYEFATAALHNSHYFPNREVALSKERFFKAGDVASSAKVGYLGAEE